MFKKFKKILEWLKKFLTPKTTPTPPVSEELEEFHYGVTPMIEREIDINGGSVEFDVWVPEAGRVTDWANANIIEITDGQSNLYELRPYKIKFCHGRNCREPRYNTRWDRWQRMRCEWSSTSWRVTVDGNTVSVGCAMPWGPRTMAIIGKPGRCYPGMKMRNIKWA